MEQLRQKHLRLKHNNLVNFEIFLRPERNPETWFETGTEAEPPANNTSVKPNRRLKKKEMEREGKVQTW